MIIATEYDDVVIRNNRLDRYLEDARGKELKRRQLLLKSYRHAINTIAVMAAELECGIKDVTP